MYKSNIDKFDNFIASKCFSLGVKIRKIQNFFVNFFDLCVILVCIVIDNITTQIANGYNKGKKREGKNDIRNDETVLRAQ